MKKKSGILILTAASFMMLMAMFILPFFAGPDHSVIRNTVSESGAQFTPHSWVVNTLMAAIALSSVISGWRCYEGFAFQRIVLLLFAISLTLAAVFNHAPVSRIVPYNIIEDGWHSYLMNAAWMSFIILTFSTALISDRSVKRQWSVITGIVAISLLFLAEEAEQTAGIWQRLQFITSFAWMVYTFKTMDQ